jgi:branched-chain amino acid transport system substrate-binding protein
MKRFRSPYSAVVTRFVASYLLTLALFSAGVVGAPAQSSAVSVALITSKTGLLGAYGLEYLQGFYAGLDYATHGTGIVNGHKINVTEYDDAGQGDKAVATAKDVIGQGTKIIAGTVWSGIAIQMAPLAQENNILYISGPAAIDQVTGANRNTFRSGRQTYQDVLAVGTVLGSNLRGKRILVFAQDSAFGKANVAAATQVLGGEGATVDSLLVPLSANDFTPFAQKVLNAKPDLLFVAWAGTTSAPMFKSLEDAGVMNAMKVATGLAESFTYPFYGSEASKIFFLNHYLPQGDPSSPANKFLIAALKKQGKVAELFTNDGFVAAQMIVHAVASANGDDVGKMISSLEGWKFVGPKGSMQIRAADHAMLQPMFIVQLIGSGSDIHARVLRTLPPNVVAPPVTPFKT